MRDLSRRAYINFVRKDLHKTNDFIKTTLSLPHMQIVTPHASINIVDLCRDGLFPTQVHSLLEFRAAYGTPQNGLRESIYTNPGHGELFGDVLERVHSSGFRARRCIYVRKPDRIVIASTKSGTTYVAEGGTRISFDLPPVGWIVPVDGQFWHPEIGIPLTTVRDKDDALRQLTAYFTDRWDQFHIWELFPWYQYYAKKRFGVGYDPMHPTPEQLAYFELSRCALTPMAGGGFSIVYRHRLNAMDGPQSIASDITLDARIREKFTRKSSTPNGSER